MEYKSISKSEQFPEGKRVSIMREMIVSSYSDFSDCKKAFVHSWTGERFVAEINSRCIESYSHAANVPDKLMRKMTHPEVYSAIRNGAVVRSGRDGKVTNFWTSDSGIEYHQICYDYTDSDSDVWQKMEVEDK